MSNIQTPLKRPQISVDRQAGKIAVFDDFSCIRDFQPFTDEAAAVAEAKTWLKQWTELEPEMVYPQITSMRITYSKPRRRKQ